MTKAQFKDLLIDIKFNLDYYLIRVPRRFFQDIKEYIHNRILFNKLIKDWRAWDYQYQIDLFTFGIEQMCNYIEKYGLEVNESRLKKVSAMKKLLYELRRDTEDEAYEKTFGEHFGDNFKHHSHAEWNKCTRLERKLYNEKINNIFTLIKGQDASKLSKMVNAEIEKIKKDDKMSKEEKETMEREGYEKVYTSFFDGTGIRGWWD